MTATGTTKVLSRHSAGAIGFEAGSADMSDRTGPIPKMGNREVSFSEVGAYSPPVTGSI